MIQAPQVQYMPALQPAPQAIPQQGLNPVNSYAAQTPGVIYNYPTTSCYCQPNAAAKSQFNGVNIEILNPQGQGLPQGAYQMPANFVPLQAPVNYSYQPMAAQPVVEAPAVPQPQIDAASAQAPVAQTPVAPDAAPAAAPAQAPEVVQPSNVDSEAYAKTFAGKLATDDLDAQKEAIFEIADLVKGDKEEGNLLLDTQVFDALTAIIDKDTSALEGPSPEVLELRAKPENELSEEDKQKAFTPSPLEKAEVNKQFALFTISYMQERLNNELVKKNESALELKDVPCIEKVIDTVKSNPNPGLRLSGIQALSHMARPEYKADLTTIFDLAKADEDASVKEGAEKALTALNA